MPDFTSCHSFQTNQPRLSAFLMTSKKDAFDAFTSGDVFTRLHKITPLAGAGLEKAVVADDFLACAICQWHHRQLDADLNAANSLCRP
jgi:hypothetical protein